MNLLRRTSVMCSVSVLLLLGTANVYAASFSFCFLNTNLDPVNTFHSVFSGTGGSLHDPVLILGSPAGTITTPHPPGSDVDITFNQTIRPFELVCFSVQGDFPVIMPETAVFGFSDPTTGLRKVVGPGVLVPEPGAGVFFSGLAVTGAALWLKRRRRATVNS